MKLKKNRHITATTFGELKGDSSEIRDISVYFDLFQNDAYSIADAQCIDLNIADLFDYSNRCLTPVGEMLLYHKLRHLSKSDTTARNEETIARIEADSDFRGKIEEALSGLADKGGGFTPGLLNMSIELSKWHRYFKFFPLFYITIVVVLWLFVSAWAALAGCLIILACNTFIHYWNKNYVETYIRPLIQLKKIRAASVKLAKIDTYNSLAEIEESISEMDDLSKKVSVFGLNRLLESELMIVVLAAIEIVKTLFLVEPIVTNTILTKIGNVNLHAKRLIDYLGEWDVLYSVSSLRVWMDRNSLDWSVPLFSESNGCVRAEEMYHPLIADCVPNSITIDNSVIITGSNMSGKSSFLKTIGVNIVASYAINTCFAKQMELLNCNLYTVLAVSDDINDAKSYYFSEVQRVKSIIDKCNDIPQNGTNIVLIDEIFKGTNTIERLSIANAVIKYFAKLKNTFVVVSTHDIEMARSFEGILSAYHFSEKIEQAELRFNYKLIPGIEYTRNAISILRSCGYPQEIIDSAELSAQKICKSMDSISL